MTNQQPTILLIEDDRALAIALQDAITSSGLTAIVAHSGEEGLAIATETNPDLILLDLVLGEVSGIDVLRKIREHKSWGANVPIIILTGMPYLKNMDEVKHLANKVIFKSDFETASLIATIKDALGQKK